MYACIFSKSAIGRQKSGGRRGFNLCHMEFKTEFLFKIYLSNIPLELTNFQFKT